MKPARRIDQSPNARPVRARPIVVQHSAGTPGANGPLTAVRRVLDSALSEQYEFVRMHQVGGNGGLNVPLLRQWTQLLRRVRPDLVHVRQACRTRDFTGCSPPGWPAAHGSWSPCTAPCGT